MLNLNESTFDAEVEQPGLILADFYGVWCPPCRMMNPVLEQTGKDYPAVRIAKVNVNENPVLTARFEIGGIPAFVLFKDGVVVERWTGLTSLESLAACLERHGASVEKASAGRLI